MTRLKLSKMLARHAAAEPEDIISVKNALYQLGFYNPKNGGLNEGWVDEALYDGIRNVQEAYNLTTDGIINPGGETEKTINALLSSKDWNSNIEERENYLSPPRGSSSIASTVSVVDAAVIAHAAVALQTVVLVQARGGHE